MQCDAGVCMWVMAGKAGVWAWCAYECTLWIVSSIQCASLAICIKGTQHEACLPPAWLLMGNPFLTDVPLSSSGVCTYAAAAVGDCCA